MFFLRECNFGQSELLLLRWCGEIFYSWKIMKLDIDI
jgi:hypothetical protein